MKNEIVAYKMKMDLVSLLETSKKTKYIFGISSNSLQIGYDINTGEVLSCLIWDDKTIGYDYSGILFVCCTNQYLNPQQIVDEILDVMRPHLDYLGCDLNDEEQQVSRDEKIENYVIG